MIYDSTGSTRCIAKENIKMYVLETIFGEIQIKYMLKPNLTLQQKPNTKDVINSNIFQRLSLVTFGHFFKLF